MANKMLIDAAHPEETRVVVVRGQRVEEFDFESAQRKPLRGNIYLAKVMRVEPSLQAAFVDYGGNRHGFLAFSEIHPDYYQIPVADREALVAEEARSARESDDDEPGPRRNRGRRAAAARNGNDASISSADAAPVDESASEETAADRKAAPGEEAPSTDQASSSQEAPSTGEAASSQETASGEAAAPIGEASWSEEAASNAEASWSELAPSREDASLDEHSPISATAESAEFSEAENLPAPQDGAAPLSHAEDAPYAEDALAANGAAEANEQVIEQLGAGDGLEEVPERRRPTRRNYKIQEVIKRRQILLVQVVKEERGNKGAALTTYLSLAGRYSVLMPNTARGGGISRKITNAPDRKRLKSVAQELDVPDGMGVIVRTAGAARTKAEIKRDFEYLLRLWENVRELTLKSSAPALVHEEGSLIKRAIRDLYNKDIDEVLVAGEEGYKEAKDFMRMLAPSHAKLVKLDKETEPVFARFGVERQLDAMFSNLVTLRSGGYIVINQTEALVAIDVNSGRATREHNIEDTALKTNLEAAEETSRQLRLRDLAGLIVIDFIDMDEKRNNRSVEKRLKDCLKNDRARIQVGSISPFGLLEMSRQRIRSGVVEGSSTPCPHCAGAGRIRSTPSVALHVLRHVEDALVKNASRNLIVKTRTDIALYILNQKRRHLRQIEDRFGVSVNFVADDKHNGVDFFAIEFGEPVAPRSEASSLEAEAQPRQLEAPSRIEDEDRADEAVETDAAEAGEEGEARPGSDGEASQKRRRRRRRRRGGAERETELAAPAVPFAEADHAQAADDQAGEAGEQDVAEAPVSSDALGAEQPRKRRRGRRGGGRARRDEGEMIAAPVSGSPMIDTPSYAASPADAESDDEMLAITRAVHDLDRSPPATPEPYDLQPSVEAAQPHAGVTVEAMPAAPADLPAEVATAASPQDADAREVAPAVEPANPEPVLTSTYDPAKAKRAGWWSKARSALSSRE
ncbi:MAG: Rne/Rng family ribonuclease [Hyphomicrobiales bacterium]